MLPTGTTGVLIYILAFFIITVTHWIYKWKNPKYKNGTLPPGSMGLPLIGETLELLIPGRSLDIHPFVKKRIQRYGLIFKTNLVGNPVVVSADPEVNHYLYLQEGKSVELWYLNNFMKIFSKYGEVKADSLTPSHRYVRRTCMTCFGAESLKEKLLPQIEILIQETLSNWSKEGSINVKKAVAKMVVNFMAKQLFNYDEANGSDDLSDCFVDFFQSLISFPLNIRGTVFHETLKKKDLVVKAIREKMLEKLNLPENYQGDLLDQVIHDMKTETFLSKDFAIHFVFAVLFASSETLSTTLTLAFQLLSEHSLIVEELRVEHEEILEKRKPGVPLTWSDYKSMTFTLQVINEVLRLANFLPGSLRRAKEDILINGYMIPQGWTIMLAYSAQQLNPNTYKDPLAFSPHRWKELESSVISKNFMPFGVGVRQCSGAEYSRVFMSTFFHVLCTEYRWTKEKGGEKISRNPALDFGDGIYINVFEKA